ncbi:MAG: type III pantothenate kinase [Pseudomonadota bacterium]
MSYILCLDVGNSNIFGGIFENDKIIFRFRYDTRNTTTSDELGLFLKSVLRENNITIQEIKKIAICSVVPQLDYSLIAACKKYFDIEPFGLQVGVKTGIKIKTAAPAEVGADLISGVIAATYRFPNKPIVVVDFGTVTTFAVMNAKKEFLGAVFLPGLRVAMESLRNNTAKLFQVEIKKPHDIVGRDTSECIQSGLYYGHLGAIHEIVSRIKQEICCDQDPVIIGTGGFAHLFVDEKIFTVIEPDLVLEGLYLALLLNA